MAEHLHNVIDDDLHFKIDPSTRRIYRTSEEPIVLVQYDHRSERISFEIPRIIDGHDMTLCDKVRIHFLNLEVDNTDAKFAGVYESTDLGVLEGDDETLLFTWLVNMDATGYAGPLNFAISFVCIGEEPNADGTTKIVGTYRWNTLPNTEDIVVSDGMNHESDFTFDYADVLDDWLNNIDNRGEFVKTEITSHANEQKLAMEQSIGAAGEEVKQSIREYAEDLKEVLGSQTLSEMGVVAQETGTATDKVMSQDATTKAVEAAKTFATSEATNVRSDLNGRCADIEDTYDDIVGSIENLKSYKKLTPYKVGSNTGNPYYKLETGKLYYVSLPYAVDRETWNVGLYATHKGTLTLNSSASSYTMTLDRMANVIVDGVGDVDTFPAYVNTYPDCYGFKIRVVDNGELRYESDNGYIWSRVSVEIITGTGVIPIKKTIPLDDNYDYLPSNLGSFSGDNNGLEIVLWGAVDGVYGNVYEFNEYPSGVSNDVTLTVNANGISSVSKTNTNGLIDTYTIALDNGDEYTFTVTNGGAGPEGKSAYEIARKNGFLGTESDWLNSLKGGDSGNAVSAKLYRHKYAVRFTNPNNGTMSATVKFVMYSMSSEPLTTVSSSSFSDVYNIARKAFYESYFVNMNSHDGKALYKTGYDLSWGGESVLIYYVDSDGTLGAFEVFSPIVTNVSVIEA